MRNTKPGKTFALIALLASFTAPHALYAQEDSGDGRQLKLPFEVEEDADFIELDEKDRPAPGGRVREEDIEQEEDIRTDSPRRDDPRDYQDDRRVDDSREILGNPRRRGDECDGLRKGDYAHAYSLYTRIYEQAGKIFVTYPVFTLEEGAERGDLDDRGNDDRRNQEQDENFIPRDQNGRPLERGVFNPNIMDPRGNMDQGMMQQQLNQGQPQMIVVERPVRRLCPVVDRFGRQVFELDPWGRPIRPLLQERIVMERVLVPNTNIQRPEPQRPDDRHDGGWQVEAGCVALPFLRTEEVSGARTVHDALRIIERNGREIKRSALRATKEQTPQNLGPFASSDPGVKSK